MKYVANLFAPIPRAANSHVRGWSQYWANHLGAKIIHDLADVKSSDEIYVDHGVNFSGGLNLFGGVSDDLAKKLAHLVKVGPKVFSLDIPMPDYSGSLAKRLGASSTSKLLTPKLIKSFGELLSKSNPVCYPCQYPEWLTVGDSHSTAYAIKGSEVHRTNGLTLHGLLKEWESRFPDLSQRRYKNLRGVTIVAGSIDVRHHLLRQPDPSEAALDLVIQLVDRATQISASGISVELCAPVPVEYEGRPLPKTGYYKGTPYFGSRSDRATLTSAIKWELSHRWGQVISPPKSWYSMNPQEYAKLIMERGGSVHISPTNYRGVIAWDVC